MFKVANSFKTDMPMLFFRHILRILCITIFVSMSVSAAEYGDIQLLIKEKKFEQALKLTEGQLANNNSDIKLQFLKGLILTRLDRLAEAEKVFLGLTRSNPELPEPYNNLAVVYAAQGKYSEAEQALKDAINTHPSYATAHENLGDIYAKMASRAYNQALELDTSNYSARAKLSLVNELISDADTESKKDKTEPKREVAKAKVEPSPVTNEPEVITVPVKTKTEVKPVAVQKPVNEPREQAVDEHQAIEKTVKDWARAWSSQNVDAYLGSYSEQFVPDDKQSFSVWKSERRKRLRRPGYIKIDISDIKINMQNASNAVVRFRQQYQSDTYGDVVTKELLLRKYSDKWLITQESTR